MGSSTELILVLAAAGGVAIAYATNFQGFKRWVDGLFSGGRFPEIIPLPEAEEDRALANCPSCGAGLSKMVRSDGKCGCINVGGTIKVPPPSKGPSNCTNAAGYTIWKGNGCFNGKQVYNVASSVPGINRCAFAREKFLAQYACKSKYAQSYQAGFSADSYPDNISVS